MKNKMLEKKADILFKQLKPNEKAMIITVLNIFAMILERRGTK